jgi:nitrogen fixation-related uncharacterized protein
MVKSIIYTLVAIALCAGFFVFTEFYLQKQFDDFHGALDELYDKVEDQTANREDAYAVKSMWANKKRDLHIFIPHNDISYIDYWLNEACSLIYTKNYDLALGKIEVLLEISKNLPDGYSVQLENVL